MVLSSQEIFKCSRSCHRVEKTQAGHGWGLTTKGQKSAEDSASCSKSQKDPRCELGLPWYLCLVPDPEG